MRGGARFTHANLLAVDLDYLAMEAVAARQELSSGLPADRAIQRFGQFLTEVEGLARDGSRQLRAMQP